eukprot:6775325-Pyramimonas_sp.AAC.3
MHLEALEENLVDASWGDRPPFPDAPLRVHPLQFAGISVADKLASVRQGRSWLPSALKIHTVALKIRPVALKIRPVALKIHPVDLKIRPVALKIHTCASPPPLKRTPPAPASGKLASRCKWASN